MMQKRKMNREFLTYEFLDENFEFNIHVEPLTGDVALIITDFADEDEVNDTIELWNKQMDILHRNLGA